MMDTHHSIPRGPGFFARNLPRLISLLVCLSASAIATSAIPLSEYHRHIKRAVTALTSLDTFDESDGALDQAKRDLEIVEGVRQILPRSETVEWNSTEVSADNSWLHDELEKYRTGKLAERPDLLRRIKERLQAIDERITEVEGPGVGVASKAEDGRKLREILARPEYLRQVKKESAISRLLQQFVEWFQNLFPKPKGVSPGVAGLFSTIAQIVVIALALGVFVFIAKLFLPRLLSARGTKKKTKPEARIVLGEHLDPDQTAVDLLAEAEALARRGELRAAIRKAYIALLLELGDRKIISLAQHKTNRDYLSAVRDIEHLYANVKQLTDSFELHWYGLAHATETDWMAFRSAYRQTLLQWTEKNIRQRPEIN